MSGTLVFMLGALIFLQLLPRGYLLDHLSLMSWTENTLEGFKSWLDEAEEGISGFGDRAEELTEWEQQK